MSIEILKRRLTQSLLLAAISIPFYVNSPKYILAAETSQPEPRVSVFLEQQNVRENEPLPVVITITNESDFPLTGAGLNITAPNFLEWQSDNCAANNVPVQLPLDLNEIPPHSVTERRLCVKINSEGSRVGDFNLLFNLRYKSVNNSKIYESNVAVEKQVKVDVFGTNEVAGIPIAFAVFFVPGMFFWLILRLRKIPFSLNLETDEKIILSVLVSILCLGLALLISYLLPAQLRLTEYFNLSNQISIAKLLTLAVTGSFLGGAYVFVYERRQNRRRRAEMANLIVPNDDYFNLIKKLLVQNPNYQGIPVLVRCKDQSMYAGAHYAKTVDSTFLVGSFVIDHQELSKELLAGIKKYTKDGHLIQNDEILTATLKLLENNRDSIKIHRTVQEYDGTQLNPLGNEYYKWTNEEALAVMRKNFDDMRLLDLG